MITEDTYRRTRCELLALHIVKTGDTVRGTATKYGISKSTVHKDITEKLKKQNVQLYRRVKRVLDKNKSERHLRGGEATKQKYSRLRLEKGA